MKLNIYIAVIIGLFFVNQTKPVMSQEIPIKMSGFVDTSYLIDENAGSAGFLLEQVELDIEKNIIGAGSLRADINFVRQYDDPSTLDNDESKLSVDDALEQGFITLENNGPISIKLGKFNAPIGLERLDPPDMFQYSHAMIFDYGLPKNLTGVNLITDYGKMNFNIYIVNGWDNISRNNPDKTVGGRLGFVSKDGANLGFSYITGNETGNAGWISPENLRVIDIDLTYPMTKNFRIGAEYNSGTHKKNNPLTPGEDDAQWNGYLLMLHYVFSSNSGLTIRYDVFDDESAARLDKPARDAGLTTLLTDEIRKSLTVAFTFKIVDGFGGLVEYRNTVSDEDVFVYKKNQVKEREFMTAMRFTYIF